MSTIALLYPPIRRARARRRDAIRNVREQAFRESGSTAMQLLGLAKRLDKVRKCSWMSGADKNASFFRMVGAFYRGVHQYARQTEEFRESVVEKVKARRAAAAEKPWYAKLGEKVASLFKR